MLLVLANQSAIVTKNGIEGTPSLIIEIISPTSVFRDRVVKKQVYEQFGVQEYWIVDPLDELVEIYSLDNSRYNLLSAASTNEGALVSNLLPGLVIDVNVLFA